MTYDICGWVEFNEGCENERVWRGVFDLSDFVMVPNEVSVHLFGFGKCAKGGLFVGRGVPSDISSEVHAEIQAIKEFERLEKNNSGIFGYTYASLAEITRDEIKQACLCSNNWGNLFEKIFEMQHKYLFLDSQIRFVVWANW